MRFLFLLIFVCLVAAAFKTVFTPRKPPQILEVEEFWRVNGAYTNDGEVFEVFYPPLNSLPR
jgi:hypothetical protein